MLIKEKTLINISAAVNNKVTIKVTENGITAENEKYKKDYIISVDDTCESLKDTMYNIRLLNTLKYILEEDYGCFGITEFEHYFGLAVVQKIIDKYIEE